MNRVLLAVDKNIISIFDALRCGIKIISTHRHVINITAITRQEKILSLVDDEIPCGPRQLRCQTLPNLKEITLLFSSQLEYEYSFSCKLRVPNNSLNINILQAAWQILLEASSPTLNTFDFAVQKQLQLGISNLLKDLNKKSKSLTNGVSGLLGLGTGLTPSGDDFLTGLTLALHLPSSPFKDRFEDLKIALLQEKYRTHILSAAFIEDALAAEVSVPVQNFISLLYSYNKESEEIKNIIQSLTALGHRSGYDLLSGILAGLPFPHNRSTALCPYIAN